MYVYVTCSETYDFIIRHTTAQIQYMEENRHPVNYNFGYYFGDLGVPNKLSQVQVSSVCSCVEKHRFECVCAHASQHHALHRRLTLQFASPP
jgi:hypothetical protein